MRSCAFATLAPLAPTLRPPTTRAIARYLIQVAPTRQGSGSSFGHVLPAAAANGDAERGAGPVQLTQACGTYGPYATIRRANEVAYEAGNLGYSTAVFHNGDGYYVRAC